MALAARPSAPATGLAPARLARRAHEHGRAPRRRRAGRARPAPAVPRGELALGGRELPRAEPRVAVVRGAVRPARLQPGRAAAPARRREARHRRLRPVGMGGAARPVRRRPGGARPLPRARATRSCRPSRCCLRSRWSRSPTRSSPGRSTNKQYAVDVLATVVVLLAAARFADRVAEPRVAVGLAALGALVVWLSFPSAFVLAGAGARPPRPAASRARAACPSSRSGRSGWPGSAASPSPTPRSRAASRRCRTRSRRGSGGFLGDDGRERRRDRARGRRPLRHGRSGPRGRRPRPRGARRRPRARLRGGRRGRLPARIGLPRDDPPRAARGRAGRRGGSARTRCCPARPSGRCRSSRCSSPAAWSRRSATRVGRASSSSRWPRWCSGSRSLPRPATRSTRGARRRWRRSSRSSRARRPRPIACSSTTSRSTGPLVPRMRLRRRGGAPRARRRAAPPPAAARLTRPVGSRARLGPAALRRRPARRVVLGRVSSARRCAGSRPHPRTWVVLSNEPDERRAELLAALDARGTRLRTIGGDGDEGVARAYLYDLSRPPS